MEDSKMEVDDSTVSETTKPKDEGKSSSAAEDMEVSNANADSTDMGSRRSSVSLEDDEEGKRNKRRKEEHPKKQEKDEYNQPKKEEHSKNSSPTNGSPKSVSGMDTAQDMDESSRGLGSPGPKVPPLKIVIPSGETEQGSRSSKNTTRHHGGLPYVVVSNEDTSTATSVVTSSPCSPSVQSVAAKEEAHSPSNVNLYSEDQKIQQRVLRSTHSNRASIFSSSSNSSNSSGNANNSTSSTNASNSSNNSSNNNNNNSSSSSSSSNNNSNSNNNNNNTGNTNNNGNTNSNNGNGNNPSNNGNSSTATTTTTTTTITTTTTTATTTSSTGSNGGNVSGGNNTPTTGNNNSGNTSGNNSNATSNCSSPAAAELSPPADSTAASSTTTKEENNGTSSAKSKTEAATSKGKSETNGSKSKNNADPVAKVKTEPEEDAKSSNVTETRSGGSGSGSGGSSVSDYQSKDTLAGVELHPRKRKLKSKQESSHLEQGEHVTSFGSVPHPHEVPVTNCYQMFMDIRRQIDVKRKGLFPIQPKPPQGFKDYLMNRCTYTLAGNSVPRLKRRNAEPPEGMPEGLKELYQEQETERYSLRMQHVVEKEKLVLSVEQEILRVHGRAARALANQALPFSACTILKDEEVYNVITPEQEEKDRNARSRYNGRLFISWLQDVDDKWEKIKEEMLARHHKEAESLNAVQKFNWDLKMRILGLWKKDTLVSVEDNFVPMISVSDDFDLLPE